MSKESPFHQIDTDVVGFMKKIRKELQDLTALSKARYGQAATAEASLAGLWYDDVPMLARAAADAFGFAPDLFKGAPCDSKGLRQIEEEVRVSGEFVTFLEATLKQVRGIHNAGRKTLCDWTYGITNQVLGLEKLPFLPPEQKALVDHVAPLLHGILDARAAGKQATKATNFRLKEEGKAHAAQVTAKLAHKEQEIAVLRGDPLPAPAPAALTPAPKKGRRTRR